MDDDVFAARYFLAKQYWPLRYKRTYGNPKIRYDDLFKKQHGMTLAEYQELKERENHAEKIQSYIAKNLRLRLRESEDRRGVQEGE